MIEKQQPLCDRDLPKSLYQNWQFTIEAGSLYAVLFRNGSRTEFEEVTFAPAGSMFNELGSGRVRARYRHGAIKGFLPEGPLANIARRTG